MSSATAQSCPHWELVAALARGELRGDAQRDIERHLERHRACREAFRHLTAGRFPQIASYTILEQIGKGGFGVVYKAIQHDKERVEALKVLFSKTPLLTSYFENEVHLIAKLRHAYIATLYEAQLSTPPLYYTMEFVDGVRLNEYLKQPSVSLGERVEIVRKVALALQYAHEQGVIHRDIKPQNILIDAAGEPHIVDFGIGKRLGLPEPDEDVSSGLALDEKRTEGPIGTVGYIAPEQAAGRAVDARADVFALGALLFYCVTGEPARLARDQPHRQRAFIERHVSNPDDFSRIVGHCVEKSPDDRYPGCRVLADDLANYLAGRPIAARTDRALVYRVQRIAALVLRTYPLTVRCTLLALVAALLTVIFWTSGARISAGTQTPSRTVMIGFQPSTLAAIRSGAIGADLPNLASTILGDTKSWRQLHGRLMERLAVAQPLVVAWDYYFPDCQPDYDPFFVRGIQALRAPVVVGVDDFDNDGEPVMCRTIRDAVTGYGWLLGVSPDYAPSEYETPHCVLRGFGAPVSSLALRAFAVTRLPDADLVVHLNRSERSLQLRYKRRIREGNDSIWHKRVDEVPLHRVQTVDENTRRFAFMKIGDRVAHGRVPAHTNEYWAARTIPYEDILTADHDQLHGWIDGRAVVIGQMFPGRDIHKNGRGEWVYGFQIHAETIDALLRGVQSLRYWRLNLAARCVLWCAIAGLFVTVQPRRKWSSLRAPALICAAIFVVALVGGALAVQRWTNPWLLESIIAVSTLLAAGSLAFLARAAQERHHQLAPREVLFDDDNATVPSTLLAETH